MDKNENTDIDDLDNFNDVDDIDEIEYLVDNILCRWWHW